MLLWLVDVINIIPNVSNEIMEGWMDGWMDGWIDGVDGWMDGWIDGVDACMYQRLHEQWIALIYCNTKCETMNG